MQEGIEKTRSLIDEKLAAFAAQKKKELNPPPKEEAPKAATSTPVDVVA